jgi:hypothetical protein
MKAYKSLILKEYKSGETWKSKNGRIGAKNQKGIIRYFDDIEPAKIYAKGKYHINSPEQAIYDKTAGMTDLEKEHEAEWQARQIYPNDEDYEAKKNHEKKLLKIMKHKDYKENKKLYKKLFTEASWNEVIIGFDITDWSDKHKYSIKKGSKYLVPMKFLADLKKQYPKYMRDLRAKSWDREGNLHSEFKCSVPDALEFIKKTGIDDNPEIQIKEEDLTAARWSFIYNGYDHQAGEFVYKMDNK